MLDKSLQVNIQTLKESLRNCLRNDFQTSIDVSA